MLLWTLSVLLAPSALSQEWDCSDVFTHVEWEGVMAEVDSAFLEFDIARAGEAARGVRHEIRCLDEIAIPSYLGRYARQMSLIAFFEQDEDTAIRWGLLQLYAAEELPWPPDLTTAHPARNVLSFVEQPPLSGPENKGLSFPKKGAVFMNGEILVRPLARAEVPNLVQVADKKGQITLQYWQDGGAFRDEVLSDDFTSVPTTPKWFESEDRSLWLAGPALFDANKVIARPKPQPKPLVEPLPPEGEATEGEATEGESAEGETSSPPPKPEPKPAVAEASPKPEPAATEATPEPKPAVAETSPQPEPAIGETEPEPKTKSGNSGPRVGALIAAGGLSVAAGTLYAVGGLSRGGLSSATTTTELAAARTRVNVLAASAGVAGLSAVGLGVTAFVDGPTLGIHLRW